MTLDNLTTFTAGTKAKASEINANFSLVEDAINENSTKIDSLSVSKVDLVNLPTDGNIVTTDANGQLVDSQKAFNDEGTTSNDIWSGDKITTELNTLTTKTVYVPQLYWSKLSNSATDYYHDINFSAGRQPNSTLGKIIELTASLTKQIDNNWNEGSMQGGLPSNLSLSNNTTYHCFVIAKADGTTDAGFDTALDACNLLADANDYIFYKRIGSIITDASSNIIMFIQNNNRFALVNEVVDINTIALVPNYTNLNITVPSGIETICFLNPIIMALAVGSHAIVHLKSTLENNNISIGAPYSGNISGYVEVPASINSQISYKIEGANYRFSMKTLGWIDLYKD